MAGHRAHSTYYTQVVYGGKWIMINYLTIYISKERLLGDRYCEAWQCDSKYPAGHLSAGAQEVSFHTKTW